MSDITKREFFVLSIDGGNYLTWAFDVEIHRASSDLSDTITQGAQSSAAQKAKTLIFLRHHLNQDLKNEYLTEKDPIVLWQSLKDRFQQQTDIILPQAQYDWPNLRFQDFKYVTEYNSAMHRIVSQVKLCNQTVTEDELIQNTLSTFHANNLVLQQQYRTKNYTTHSELISTLLVAEKHNKLLMKNHNARPVGSQMVPEAHAIAHRNNNMRGRGKGRGRGRGQGNPSWTYKGGRGRGNFDRVQYHGRGMNNFKPFTRKTISTQPSTSQKNVCFRCGCDDHWSRICRTPKHLVEVYQNAKKKGKTTHGESHHASLPEANMIMNFDNNNSSKLELGDFGDNE